MTVMLSVWVYCDLFFTIKLMPNLYILPVGDSWLVEGQQENRSRETG